MVDGAAAVQTRTTNPNQGFPTEHLHLPPPKYKGPLGYRLPFNPLQIINEPAKTEAAKSTKPWLLLAISIKDAKFTNC